MLSERFTAGVLAFLVAVATFVIAAVLVPSQYWYVAFWAALFMLLTGVIYWSFFFKARRQWRRGIDLSATTTEQQVHVTHKHRVALLGSAIFGCLAVLCLGLTCAFLLNDTALKYGDLKGDAFIDLKLWWMPLLLGVSSTVRALMGWADWKRFSYGLTTERLVSTWRVWPWFPWQGPVTDQTPLEQIVDIDEKTGAFGNYFGWGSIIVEYRQQQGADKAETKTLVLVPNHHLFANGLRALLKEYREQQQSPPQVNPEEMAHLVHLGMRWLEMQVPADQMPSPDVAVESDDDVDGPPTL